MINFLKGLFLSPNETQPNDTSVDDAYNETQSVKIQVTDDLYIAKSKLANLLDQLKNNEEEK